MRIKTSFVVILATALILFPYSDGNEVFSQDIDTSLNANPDKSDEDVWKDLWFMTSGESITIVYRGHEVTKDSKEYAKLLKVCKDKAK